MSQGRMIVIMVVSSIILALGFIADIVLSEKKEIDVVVIEKVYKPEDTYTVVEYDVALEMNVTKTKTDPEKYLLIVNEIGDYTYAFDDNDSPDTFTMRVSSKEYGNTNVEDVKTVNVYYGYFTGWKYNFN